MTTRDEINDYLMSIEYFYFNNSDRTSSDTASQVIIPTCQVPVQEPHVASPIGEEEFKALGNVASPIWDDAFEEFEDADSRGYQETNMSSVSKTRTVKKKNCCNTLLGYSARSDDGSACSDSSPAITGRSVEDHSVDSIVDKCDLPQAASTTWTATCDHSPALDGKFPLPSVDWGPSPAIVVDGKSCSGQFSAASTSTIDPPWDPLSIMVDGEHAPPVKAKWGAACPSRWSVVCAKRSD